MTIYEAIEHAREVAEGCPAEDRQCAYQHDKLADWLEELVILRAKQEAEKNEPLSYEDLLKMDGQPVWMVGKHMKSQWDIVVVNDDDRPSVYFRYKNPCLFQRNGYGKTWLAYRRPPVGEVADAK